MIQHSLFGLDAETPLDAPPATEVSIHAEAQANAPSGNSSPVPAVIAAPSSEPEQPALFDKGEWWHEHWKGMPEYISEDLTPFRTIYVHFEKREDVDAFAVLIGQRIGPNVKSIWYPEAEIGHYIDKLYVDSVPNGAA